MSWVDISSFILIWDVELGSLEVLLFIIREFLVEIVFFWFFDLMLCLIGF